MEQIEPSIIAMLNGIYRAAPVGIGMVRNRVFCQVNDRVCEITGYSRQELIGQSSRMVYPSQEEYDQAGRDKDDQIRRLGVGTVQTRWQRKDGAILDILLNSSPLNQNDLSEGVVFTATDITDRKRAEEALSEKNLFIASLLRAIPVAVFYKDREGKYLGCNDKFTDIVGVTAEQIRGKTVQEFWPSKLAEKFHSMDLELMRNGEHQVYEYQVKTKEGQLHPVIFAKDVFRDKNGEVAGLVGAFLDITERKRTEEALQNAAVKYRIVADNTYDWEFWIDLNDHYVYVSPSCRRVSGYTVEEFMTDPDLIIKIIHPDDRQCYQAHSVSARTEKTDKGIEFRIINKDGQVRWIEHFCQPVFDNDGKWLGIRGSNRDITDRKRADKALNESEERYRVSALMTGQLIYDYDCLAGSIKWVGSIPSITGYTTKEFEGINVDAWSEMIHPDDRGAILRTLNEAMADKKTFLVEYRFRRKDGSFVWVEDTGSFLYNDQGKAHRMLGTMKDIGGRKEAEKTLLESEQRFRRIVEASPMGMHLYEVNPAGEMILIDANPAADRITGIRNADLLNLPIEKAFPGLVNTDIPKRFKDVALGHARSFELRDHKYNDPQIHGVFDMHIFQSSPGRMTVMFMEVTGRIQAEKETRLNAQRTLALLRLNQMTTASIREITDFALEEAVQLTESRVGYLAFMNEDETVLSMYSWSRTAMAECSMSDKPLQYPLETIGLWGEAVRQRKPVITNDYPAPNPLKKGYPQGHVPILRHMNVPVFVGSHIVLVAGVGNKEEPYNQTDVQQLTLLMEGMWRLIERQRAEQQREQLLKALQTKTEELESIIYVSSHDLRSPLVNIQGFSGELDESCRQVRKLLSGDAMSVSDQQQLEELLGQDIPSAIEYITTSVSKLDALQKGLLKICRIGRETLDIAPVAMNELIDGTLKSTRYQLDNAAAQVIVDPLPTCLADAAQLTQVFTNLIDNAIKYRSPERPLVIRINGRVEGDHCVYAVADNGVGIAPEHQQKVFEMFHQLDPLNGPGGEGLGLTIVKRVLGRMDGQVRLESALGVGSVFFVLLPKA